MGEKVEVIADKGGVPSDYTLSSIYELQLMELAEIRNPAADDDGKDSLVQELKKDIQPVIVLFPWRKIALETVPENVFYELKTNRNRNLIATEEQMKLYSLSISVAGMSVGSSLLYGLVGSGIGKNLTLADDDTLDTTNLNRVQATILDIGKSKVQIATQKLLEMNPFVNVSQLGRITDQNIDEFIGGDTSIIFEEIDDFLMKVRLREEAKHRGIPLVMLTNIGDSVMIDVERYDRDGDVQLFNGLVDDETIEEIREQEVDTQLMKELSVKLVQKDLIPERAIESLKQIGDTLAGRPQLYGTVALDAGIAPYLVRRIFIEDNLPSGRYTVQMKESINA